MTILPAPRRGRVQRAYFERMVAQVCLGKVGALAAREVSHFARNSQDWQQLIEMCPVVDTVLADQETIMRHVMATTPRSQRKSQRCCGSVRCRPLRDGAP